MFRLIKTYLNYVIDLILPKTCLHCQIRIGKDENFICKKCENSLEFLVENICEFCGKPLENEKCKACNNEDFKFDKVRSVFPFNDILRNIIHSLKYEEMTSIGTFLGKFAAVYLKKFTPFERVDIIAPVPLHKVKKSIRGFNQSAYLSRKIAEEMNWDHIPKLVLRKKFTDSQTRLSAAGRQKNVSNAFLLNKKYEVKAKNILLIDDVFTTGSTVNSISKHLKERAANKVFVLTIARA